MGGLVPLGYDRVEKQLMVNEQEAKTVRHIYTRYLALGCVRDLKAELDAEGYRSKARPDHHKTQGSKPFSRGALYTILKNPTYIAKVHHKKMLHNGKHAAILDNELWQAVQGKLARNRLDIQAKASVKHPSLLAGLVYDDRGNRMSPTYTRRKNRHYPYYISQAVLQYREDEAGSVIRVPGKTLEDQVTKLMLEFLGSPEKLLDFLGPYQLSGESLSKAIQAGSDFSRTWFDMSTRQQIPVISNLLSRVDVSRAGVKVTLNRSQLYHRLTGDSAPNSINETLPDSITLKAQVNLRRSGIETKLVYPAGEAPAVHNRSIKALQKALLTSLEWNEDLLNGRVRSIDALIERDKLNSRQVYRLRKLAFLAPDIMERIIAGDVPDTLTLERLKKDFPLDWQAQRNHFRLSQNHH
jgi:site-specific DNA recombinase